MAITAIPRTEDEPQGPSARSTEPVDRAFLRWGLGFQLGVTALIVAAVVIWVGRLTYALDDAAIHLALADRLAHDGTWGVVAGQFESASSSPLWTLLTAAGVLVAGPAADWVPLVLNVAAGAAVVWLLAQSQQVVRPGRHATRSTWRRPWCSSSVVLFLPGLALVGMEHTLHTALVLAAVLAVHRWALERPGPGPVATGAVIALASLTRFETAFVALGLAAALVVVDRRRPGPPGRGGPRVVGGSHRGLLPVQPGHGGRLAAELAARQGSGHRPGPERRAHPHRHRRPGRR